MDNILLQTAIIVSSVMGWLAFSYAFISFFEYQIHRHLMHRKRLPKWVYRACPYILDTFQAHAVEHHGIWYREFDYEPDDHGREHNLDIKIRHTIVMILALAPIFVPLIWFFPLGGTILLAVSVIHNRMWNMLHRQMHIPKKVIYRNWPMFRFLARHHFMHHQRSTKNYNVVFPMFDYLFGSVAKPRFRDIREMLRLGYVKPKTARSQALLERWRQEVQLRRAAAA